MTTVVGRMTSAQRMTPSFIIVGAQRCGTTSLYKTLANHPHVLPAVLHKGIHYFDTDYGRGFDWYRGHFPLRQSAIRRARRHGANVLTGESSPYYMFHPLSAARIARDLPGVKIIVMLRDPAERAYSAYTHEAARGFESESFSRALELEPTRLAGEEERLIADPTYRSHHHQHHAYVTRGQYVDQVERLEALFDREHLCVIDSDDLFLDAGPVLDRIFRFLGFPSPSPEHFQRRNARPRSTMPDSIRRQLHDHFEPYDERLAKWWDRTPSWRR